jgi:methionine-gamma-lyase
MLGRSLETLHLRMERASNSAAEIARYLSTHPKVDAVYHPDFIKDEAYRRVFQKTAQAGGSTFSFMLKSGEAGAFRFLNDLHLFTLAVSLGGTESLISHPASTTHSGVAKEIRDKVGVTDALVRVSVGLENPQDLIADLEGALEKV